MEPSPALRVPQNHAMQHHLFKLKIIFINKLNDLILLIILNIIYSFRDSIVGNAGDFEKTSLHVSCVYFRSLIFILAQNAFIL